MAFKERYLTVLVVLAVILKCEAAAEILSSDEILSAIESDPPRELPFYVSVPSFQKDYSKRSNLNKFKSKSRRFYRENKL